MPCLRGAASAIVLGLCCAPPAFADDAALARVFARQRAEGTLVIASLDGGTLYVHNTARARKRFTPASTFKVPNSAIALQEGVIDERQPIRWDGKDRGRREWNRDHTLASAFQVSCVWCYQVLARRVGAKKYRDYLARLRYGNARIGEDVTTFWLDGSLQVSALEQIAFLRALSARKLPFRDAVYDALARIMILERGPKHVLRAKTGWSLESKIGWLVGEVALEGGKRWLFAMNLDVASNADAAKRLAITREALRAKGILP